MFFNIWNIINTSIHIIYIYINNIFNITDIIINIIYIYMKNSFNIINIFYIIFSYIKNICDVIKNTFKTSIFFN